MEKQSSSTGGDQKPKMNFRRRMRMHLRQKLTFVVAGALFLSAIVICFIFFFQFAKIEKTHAAANGDYKAVATGNWSTAAIWQKYNGSTWAAAGSAPSTGHAIEIQSPYTVTVSSAVTANGITIDAGATLVVASAQTLTVSHNSGTDITVNGILTESGSITMNASATMAVNDSMTVAAGTLTVNASAAISVNSAGIFKYTGGTLTIPSGCLTFNSGATYIHALNGGTIPTATWNANSTCQITGLTTTYPAGTGQTFGHILFNSAITANLEMLSGITCAGNMTIAGTGAKILYLTNSATNRTITTGGDFDVSGGTFASVNSTGTGTLTVPGNFNLSGGTFNLKNGAGAAVLNITGNLNMTGGAFYSRPANTTSTATIAVTGNFSLSVGTFDLSDVAAVGTLNVAGNFSHTGGTITQTSTGSGAVVFNGIEPQTYTSGGTVANAINYTVNSGATLVMGASFLGSGSSGAFTLSSGATLDIGDPSGITTSGANGNIRVMGTRSYNSGANYIYNGASAQNTGNGLPATVNDLTVNNSSGLTLTSATAVSDTLTLTSGTITTGLNVLSTTSSSTTAIVGYSSASYVVGNLKLTVNGTATASGFPVYPFPLGTASHYELLQLTLKNTSGFTTVTGTFTNANPINILYPLIDTISGAVINKMLDYGYWTLAPNTAMTGGAIGVAASETGFSGAVSGSNVYTVITRANILSLWLQNGNTEAPGYKNSAVTANETGISTFGDFGIGYGVGPPILAFTNHTLISGTDLQPGAIYLFQDVGIGLDAWIEITDFQNGATISDIDNWTYPNGYDNAWQPFVNSTPNDTSSVGWKIMFKVAGTSTDTALSNLTFAAVDVDGDNSSVSEFVEAYHPASITYAPTTLLTFVNQGGNFFAYGPIANIPNIDTSQTQGVFKVNYKNISSFLYRTGAINRGNTAEVRQASLYFKTFTLPNATNVLPIKLAYFNAQLRSGSGNSSGATATASVVNLDWATASEVNNNYFTVERSQDAVNFQTLITRQGAGNSTTTLYYSAVDDAPLTGYSYYRLKQTDYDGHFTYSNIVSINNNGSNTNGLALEIKIQSIAPTLFTESFNLGFTIQDATGIDLQLFNLSGQLVYATKIETVAGYNNYQFHDEANLPKGIYFVNLSYSNQRVTQKVVKQ